MFNVLPRPDVTLFGLVHGILTAERARDIAERRAGGRHPYRCIQLIAPLQEDRPLGQLQFRPVQADGRKGDWQPLATLVRVPVLKELRCPESPDQACQLSGTNLFLIDSVGSDQQFTHTALVPTGFIDSTISVPRPAETRLYIKLRDDPTATNTVVLPVLPEDQHETSAAQNK